MTSQIVLTLTINSKKIKKHQSCKIDVTRFINNHNMRLFLFKNLTFIDIVGQSSISETVSKSKNDYILGRMEYFFKDYP